MQATSLISRTPRQSQREWLYAAVIATALGGAILGFMVGLTW